MDSDESELEFLDDGSSRDTEDNVYSSDFSSDGGKCVKPPRNIRRCPPGVDIVRAGLYGTGCRKTGVLSAKTPYEDVLRSAKTHLGPGVLGQGVDLGLAFQSATR
ncbi:hypothetical protein HPB50_026546 [Hyalomma asiaticum]|uniref:Uncharacterized protein n=1 Tax=Hyalomma asiaticum TaxID=266040 RepID=A0ACB7TML0_HYAAI|nr:hypothetical protein HPB50_026546 [Hyalomma asiaticum]